MIQMSKGYEDREEVEPSEKHSRDEHLPEFYQHQQT